VWIQNSRKTIAIFVPSNVDFVVSLFALSMLGYIVLYFSLRLTPVTIINLLNQAECNTIVHGRLQQIE
jgi:acyl-CoA synthetase (AMP-forming)/AMP-acid ligase II